MLLCVGMTVINILENSPSASHLLHVGVASLPWTKRWRVFCRQHSSCCWQPTCLLGPVFRSGLKQEGDLSPITCLSPLHLLLRPFPRYEQKHRLNQRLKPACCRSEGLRDLPTSTTGSSVYDAGILWEGRDISFPSKWKASTPQPAGRQTRFSPHQV